MIGYYFDKTYARRLANAIGNVMGTPASLIKENGVAWRVQHDGISHEAVDIIESMLGAGERYTSITRERVEAHLPTVVS